MPANRLLLTLVFTTGCLILAAQTPSAVTLEQVIHEAVTNNLDLAAERYGITLATFRRKNRSSNAR
jgi:hypothetical protein